MTNRIDRRKAGRQERERLRAGRDGGGRGYNAGCAGHSDAARHPERSKAAGELRGVLHRHIPAPPALQGVLLSRVAARGE